ncbi:MAG: hypothetical protein ONB16_06940 [candidate division KSB1 bacterium]|nr:hypothetical protein [candidate division KSB1 bacterium]MDZ7318562.1 hypothetical protein [candidate division KSB1 bacterium]MDZ7342546.1 hypothetical protein [candidate division KSB1 bacterium]
MRAKLIRQFTRKRFVLPLLVGIGLILLEFTTSFVEIALGTLLEVTNPWRSQSGTVWELHKKDALASQQLQHIAAAAQQQPMVFHAVGDLLQLKSALDSLRSITLTADQFLNLYHQFPPPVAFEMISPFDLLKLSHSGKWVWTKIVKDEHSLSIYCLDGEKQLLMDAYPPLTVLYDLAGTMNFRSVSLDSMPQYAGRIVSRDQFFQAFDDLASAVKMQIINNPALLIKWDKNIRRVGIARYPIDNMVNIGFEINNGLYIDVISFGASEWAADFLIEKLNALYPELNLEPPN